MKIDTMQLLEIFWASGSVFLVVSVCVIWWSEWKRAALLAITARLPVKTLQRPGEPRYAEWYHLFTVPGFTFLGLRFGGVRVQINRFVGHDPDGLHDHPWDWARTFILLGWYWEDRRGRGMSMRVNRRRFGYSMTGDTFHRVRMPEGQREVWTLFLFGPYTKSWGFLRPALVSEEFTYRPRGSNNVPFDPWPRTARTGAQLRAQDEVEQQFGVGAWCGWCVPPCRHDEAEQQSGVGAL